MMKKIAISLLIFAFVFLILLTEGSVHASQTEFALESAPTLPVVESAVFYNNPLVQSSGDCDNDDPGGKMKCQYQKLADSICETSDLLQDSTISYLSDKKEKLQRYCDSTQAWIDAPGREDDFKNAFKKKDAACYIVEITDDNIGDDDGICTKNEQNKDGCFEDDEDNIGDNDGVCEVTKEGKGKKVREPCLQVCEIDATGDPADEELYDFTQMDMVGSALEMAAEDVNNLNASLYNKMQEWEDVTVALHTKNVASNADPEKCVGLLTYGKFDPDSEIVEAAVSIDGETRPATYETLDFARTYATYYAILGEVCDDAATVNWEAGVGSEVGGSTQAWCVGPHAADAILKDMTDGLELLDDAITGTRVDNAVKCLEYVAKNLKGIQGSLDYKVEWRRIHLQVIELKEKQEFLVNATEYGRADHLMAEDYRLRVSTKDWLGFVDITANSTWTEAEPGVYLVQISLPREVRNAELFWFEVSHSQQMVDQDGAPILDENNNPIFVEHSGSLIFDRNNQNSGSAGQ